MLDTLAKNFNDCSSVDPHRFTGSSDVVKDLDKIRAEAQQNETQADRRVDSVIEQLDCWEKETRRLTIQHRWARDQSVTMVIKEYDKLETEIFKPRPQPQNCIKFAVLSEHNCGSYRCIDGLATICRYHLSTILLFS